MQSLRSALSRAVAGYPFGDRLRKHGDHRFRTGGLVVAVSILAACGAGLAGEGATRPVPLSEEPGLGDRVGALRFRGGLDLRHDDPAFGGLSSLRVTPEGTGFTALSDRGHVVTGRLIHDAEGRLTGAADLTVAPLRDSDGSVLAGRRSDSEEMAHLPGGGWVVSFEREHRLMRYPEVLAAGTPTAMTGPDGLSGLGGNSGIEAMAALPDGTLVLIAEGGAGEERHRGWLGGADGWQPFTYLAQPPYRPVGAAVLPDGDLLVLERRYSWPAGVGARIARVPRQGLVAGAEVSGETVARLERPLTVDNYEGIDVRRPPGGPTRIYLISDDNFSASQRTLLLVFDLEEGRR